MVPKAKGFSSSDSTFCDILVEKWHMILNLGTRKHWSKFASLGRRCKEIDEIKSIMNNSLDLFSHRRGSRDSTSSKCCASLLFSWRW